MLLILSGFPWKHKKEKQVHFYFEINLLPKTLFKQSFSTPNCVSEGEYDFQSANFVIFRNHEEGSVHRSRLVISRLKLFREEHGARRLKLKIVNHHEYVNLGKTLSAATDRVARETQVDICYRKDYAARD